MNEPTNKVQYLLSLILAIELSAPCGATVHEKNNVLTVTKLAIQANEIEYIDMAIIRCENFLGKVVTNSCCG